MAELILYPTSDISHGDLWDPYSYTNINEIVLNEGDYAAAVYASDTSQYVSYGWTNHTTESGAITDVTMYAQANKTNEGAGCSIIMYLGCPNVSYQSNIKTITTSSTLFSYSWATNPATSTDWTWDDIDGITAAITGASTDTTKDDFSKLYVYQSKIVVTFTPGGGWANIAKFNGVASASIAKINGVAVASIAKINGVAV